MLIKDVGKFSVGMAFAEAARKNKQKAQTCENKKKYEQTRRQYEYLAVAKGLMI